MGCNRSNAMVVFDLATAKVAHQLECAGFPLRVRAKPSAPSGSAWFASTLPASRSITDTEPGATCET